jgi:putative transposase
MRSQRYPSDLTDAQWERVKPFIPVYPGGRPRRTSIRDVVDAIFYLVRTGCQWRFLPKDFPPKSTVWGYFDEWRHNGTFELIHDALRDRVRKEEKPGRPRRTASIDSQSVDTSSGGEARGRDNAKNVNGRKRHIIVDSLGLLLAVAVTAANVDDAAAAPEALQQLTDQPLGHVRRVFADNKYHNHALYGWVAENGWYELEIVRRPKDSQGWVTLPIRWTVERTFAWLTKCRRLSIDREKSTLSAKAMIYLAMIHMMLNRLSPQEHQQEFQYHNVA